MRRYTKWLMLVICVVVAAHTRSVVSAAVRIPATPESGTNLELAPDETSRKPFGISISGAKMTVNGKDAKGRQVKVELVQSGQSVWLDGRSVLLLQMRASSQDPVIVPLGIVEAYDMALTKAAPSKQEYGRYSSVVLIGKPDGSAKPVVFENRHYPVVFVQLIGSDPVAGPHRVAALVNVYADPYTGRIEPRDLRLAPVGLVPGTRVRLQSGFQLPISYKVGSRTVKKLLLSGGFNITPDGKLRIHADSKTKGG